MDEELDTAKEELTSRAPTTGDLAALAGELNRLGAKYIVVGGFAIINSGYPRSTMDLDLVVATDLENEAKVYEALATLPDQAVLELEPGEIAKYTVIRVGDEICVDLMASASGIGYEEAAQDQIIRVIAGVPIPFASPRTLYRMKENTHREKDRADLQFLRENYAEEIFGETKDL
ncbi:MAG: hypothetical protein EOP83_26485 [Verrucomicrobiaceae bacterium]|nr:MAG: hypothetical protein EOP83_26485 [Verrucomicrobiaceae bacterium]